MKKRQTRQKFIYIASTKIDRILERKFHSKPGPIRAFYKWFHFDSSFECSAISRYFDRSVRQRDVFCSVGGQRKKKRKLASASCKVCNARGGGRERRRRRRKVWRGNRTKLNFRLCFRNGKPKSGVTLVIDFLAIFRLLEIGTINRNTLV